MIKKFFAYSLAIILILCLGFFWRHSQQHVQPKSTFQNPTVSVQVAKVSSADIPNYLVSMGVLQAQQISNISSDVAGKVANILYQPGAYIKKGTPLIQLDNRTYQADLDSAKAALALAKVTYERNQSLESVGAQPKQVIDQMRADFLQAQAKVASMQTLVDETTIRAPFDGYVGAKNVNVGDYVQVGQTLTILVNRERLQVNYQFPERYLLQLKLGQTVTLTLPSEPKKDRTQFYGVLTYISPAVDPTTHSVALQADVPNPDNRLAPGLFVKVKESIGVSQQAMVVPEASLVPTITGAEVYRVINGKAEAVPVQVGETFSNQVQILNGLKMGDIIVVAGQQMLNTGTPVKEVNQP